MTRVLKTITCIALVGIALLAVTGFPEEVLVKQNEWDRTIYWKYLFDTRDGFRVFFNDARVQSFWFKKGMKEFTVELDNPVFLVRSDAMTGYRYASIGDELFCTYRMYDKVAGERVSSSYALCIQGLDQATTPCIRNLGKFSQDNAEVVQVVKIGKYFVTLTTYLDGHEIKIYDEYKRQVAKYPVIRTTISISYSTTKNEIYLVGPDGGLTSVDMSTLYPTAFSFDENTPGVHIPEPVPILPLLTIFASDPGCNYLYYAIPSNSGTEPAALLMEADLSAKKVRAVSELKTTRYIVKVLPYNRRYVELLLFSEHRGSTVHLFDTYTKEFIPLKGIFNKFPIYFCATVEGARSTPYLHEKTNNNHYKLTFFDNFAFDDASIDLIRK